MEEINIICFKKEKEQLETDKITLRTEKNQLLNDLNAYTRISKLLTFSN